MLYISVCMVGLAAPTTAERLIRSGLGLATKFTKVQ